MQKRERTNRHQRIFLRRLREHPSGLPRQEWPNPVTLRRWLRHDGFCRAMHSVRLAMQMQTDLQLMSAAALASGGLSNVLIATGGGESTGALPPAEGLSPKEATAQLGALVALLRLTHGRLRELRRWDDQRDALAARLAEAKTPAAGHPLHGRVHPQHWRRANHMADAWSYIAGHPAQGEDDGR